MSYIFQALIPKQNPVIRELFGEYLGWVNEMVNRHYGVRFNMLAVIEGDMTRLDKFFPPSGALLLAQTGGHIAGMASMVRMASDTGEVRRMYVRPEFRGQGIGRLLVDGLEQCAHRAGYSRLLLDSARFMEPAHRLYRACGFRDIRPYPGSEIPPDFQPHWIFMEKSLSPSNLLPSTNPTP